ncbi:Mg2+ and Co2+ transporter CorA [Bradyrhizobium sp. AZCC 1693]
MNVPSLASAATERMASEGVVAAGVYVDGRRIANIAIEEASSWRRKPGHVVWIGLYEPDLALLKSVQQQFDLHDLAIEDANHAHQRPKIEQYGDGLFIVARTAQLIEGRIAFGETHLFVGEGYLVSVRHGASTSYAPVRERCESCPRALARGEDYILYAILDFIVDNYSPVLETIHEEVEAIEDDVLANPITRSQVERLYMLRRDLLRLRNAIGPLVEVCRRLEHDNLPMVRSTMQALFRDVTDHVRTIQERTDSMREVLAFAFEASLLVGPGAGDRRLQEAGLVARHHRRADRGGRHLRDEFQAHARTGMGVRIFHGARTDADRLRRIVLAIPPRGMAVSGKARPLTSSSQNFDPVILDHRVRQQLVGGILQRRLCLGLVGARELDVEHLALADAGDAIDAERFQRAFDGLALRVENA